MLVALRQHPAAIGVTERIIGLELDRLIEVGERAIEIAKGGERAVAIVEQIGVVPYQLDGAVVIVKSPSVVLLGGVGPAAVVVDFGVVGLELDGLVVVVDGKVAVWEKEKPRLR